MRRVALLSAALALLASAAAALAHPGHGPVTIDVRNRLFTPNDVIVGRGDSVEWFFSGSPVDRNHSVTADPGQAESFDSDPGVPSPPAKPFDSTFSHSFQQTGTFTYFCKNHPGMRGSVEVREITGSVDLIPPVLGRAKLARTRVCGRRAGACRRTSALLTYRLSEPGDVGVRFERRIRGRWRTVRFRDFTARRGRNRQRVSFRGLAAGRIRLELRAYDLADNESNVVHLRVRVVR